MTPLVRFLVHVAFVYTCVEGLIINILYPDRLPFIYKDILLAAIYTGLILPDLKRLVNPSPLAKYINAGIILFASFVVLSLLLPTSLSLLSMLVAVKQRLFYIPLLVVGYYFIRSVEDLRWLVITLAIYAIGVSAFGIYLFFTGPEGLRAFGAAYSAVIYAPDTSVDVWRVPGPFTSPGQYGGYLMFNGMAVSALVFDAEAPRWSRYLGAVSLASIALAMMASGSRTPMILATGGIAAALVMSGWLARTLSWAVGLYAILAYGFATLGPGVRDRVGSIASAQHLERFKGTYFGQLFATPLREFPLGAGLGVATIGARHFTELGQVVLMESYLGVIAVELGWPGLIAFLVLTAAILAFIVQHRSVMQATPEASYWLFFASFVLAIIAIFPVNTYIDSAPGNLYFWFSVGVLIRLVELQYWRRWEASQQTGPKAAGGAVQPATTA